MTKNIIYGVVGLVVLIAIFVIGKSFGSTTINQTGGAGSTVGATNNSAKLASVAMAPLTGTATSSSILNTDGVDRFVTDSFLQCTSATTTYSAYLGNGLAAKGWTLYVSTTTTAASSTNSNFAAVMPIATSTVASGSGANPGVASPSLGNTNLATSTEGVLQFLSGIWPTNTYMTYQFNATNTAACVVGSHYYVL